MCVKVSQCVLVKVAIIIKISVKQRLVPLLSGGHWCLFRSCFGSLSPFSSSLLCRALHSKVLHSFSPPGVCSFHCLNSLYHQPLLCSLVEILPGAKLLPVIPRPCTPGVLFQLSLKPVNTSCKACCFSAITPSPQSAVLLSHGVRSWGISVPQGVSFRTR